MIEDLLKITESLTIEQLILVLVLLNISLVLLIIWCVLTYRETQREFQAATMLHNEMSDEVARMVKRAEKREDVNASSIKRLDIQVDRLKDDIYYLKQSLDRFAPPLDRDKEYKTVNVLNGKLK